MSNRLACSKKDSSCRVYTFPTNNMSKKMLNSQAVKLNGRKAIVQNNTRLQSIYETILKGDAVDNKKLLMTFRHTLYMRYFRAVVNCSVATDLVHRLTNMLHEIIAGLTQEEYNYVFNIVTVNTSTVTEVAPPGDLVVYVITRRLLNVSYFIALNLRDDFMFLHDHVYTFDLSDPSNLGTKFSLSLLQDGHTFSGVKYYGTPGTPGAQLALTLPKYINGFRMFVFNDLERYPGTNNINTVAYSNWGYCFTSINVLSANSPYTATLSNYIYQCMHPHSSLSVYEYKGPKYMINNYDNPSVLIELNPYRYQVSVGTYYLTVPKVYMATLLNKGQEQAISFVGILPEFKATKYIQQLSMAPGSPPDGSYNFYYETVQMTVYKPFTDALSFYCKDFGFMNAFGLINYSDACSEFARPPETLIYTTDLSLNYDFFGLARQSNVNYVANGPSLYMTFNNDTQSYYSTRRYGIYIGDYTLFGIPANRAITLLNYGKEDLVVITSRTPGATVKGVGPDGRIYTFYYGVVDFRICGNVGKLSIYSIYDGYMGGYGLFVYDPKFSNHTSYLDPLSIPTITELPANTTFDDPYTDPVYVPLLVTLTDTSTSLQTLYLPSTVIVYNEITFDMQNNIIINDNTPYNNQIKYTMTHGIYIFRAMGTYMTILNNQKELAVSCIGGLSKSKIGPDGNKYYYFRDVLVVYSYSRFGTVTLDIENKSSGLYLLAYI
jgi:hypothetical protein